jgi:hypothetical protein
VRGREAELEKRPGPLSLEKARQRGGVEGEAVSRSVAVSGFQERRATSARRKDAMTTAQSFLHPLAARRRGGPLLAMGLTALLAAAACGGATAGMSSSGSLLASTRPASDVAWSPAATREPGSAAGRVPEETLRDPARLMEARQWVRRQIVIQARAIPEDRYQRRVRPRLVRQLGDSGFAAEDVQAILADVDYSRRLQGHRELR